MFLLQSKPDHLQPKTKYERQTALFLAIRSHFHLHVCYFLTAAISYSVEADGYHRKQGLASRVLFLNKSSSDLDYQYNGTIDLRSQNQETCITLKARLKVT